MALRGSKHFTLNRKHARTPHDDLWKERGAQKCIVDFLMSECIHWVQWFCVCVLSIPSSPFCAVVVPHTDARMCPLVTLPANSFPPACVPASGRSPRRGPIVRPAFLIPPTEHMAVLSLKVVYPSSQRLLAGWVLSWASLGVECGVMEKPVPWRLARSFTGLGGVSWVPR